MDTTKTVSGVRTVPLIKTIFFSFAFLIPATLSGPQLLIGSFINALLFISSIKLDRKSLLFLTMLPSIGAFAHGVIFGPYTFFLFYFLPFIWVGNYLLVATFKQEKLISSTSFRILLASIIKAIFLYTVANIYFGFHIVPALFVSSMGLIQFETALIGGAIAFAVLKIKIKY